MRPYIYAPISLLEFLAQVFGADELEHHEFGPESCHVELQIGDSILVVEAGELPPDVHAWTNSVYVYVQDVDSVYARAIALGAKPITEPVEKLYQERQAGCQDSAGNTWWVGTYCHIK